MKESVKIAKRAKLLNILLIIWVLIMFICFNFYEVLPFERFEWINTAVTFVLLILSVLTFIKMKKYNIHGDIPLLIAAIMTFVFSIFGLMLGIIVFVLSSMSIRKISEFIQEEEI